MTTRRTMTILLAAGLAQPALVCQALAQSDPLDEPFPVALELADLDGAIGFRLDGVDAGDRSGFLSLNALSRKIASDPSLVATAMSTDSEDSRWTWYRNVSLSGAHVAYS